MKILVFAACVLAAVTISHTLPVKLSIIFDLLDFRKTHAECVKELGLPETSDARITYCIAEKKNLLDEEGKIKWDEALNYVRKLILNSKKAEALKEVFQKCKEEADNFEGSIKEKALKAMECGLSTKQYIMQQKL